MHTGYSEEKETLGFGVTFPPSRRQNGENSGECIALA